jgi:hypothetical protein
VSKLERAIGAYRYLQKVFQLDAIKYCLLPSRGFRSGTHTTTYFSSKGPKKSEVEIFRGRV